MAGKNSDDSGFMDKIMNRIKDSREGTPNKTDPSQKKMRFSIWYFIAAMLFFALFQSGLGGQQREKITYSDFKQWVREGKVENLVVGPEAISGDMKDEKGKTNMSIDNRHRIPEAVLSIEKDVLGFRRLTELRQELGKLPDCTLRTRIISSIESLLNNGMNTGSLDESGSDESYNPYSRKIKT